MWLIFCTCILSAQHRLQVLTAKMKDSPEDKGGVCESERKWHRAYQIPGNVTRLPPPHHSPSGSFKSGHTCVSLSLWKAGQESKVLHCVASAKLAVSKQIWLRARFAPLQRNWGHFLSVTLRDGIKQQEGRENMSDVSYISLGKLKF